MRVRIEWSTGFLEIDYDALMGWATKRGSKKYKAIMKLAQANGGWKLVGGQ